MMREKKEKKFIIEEEFKKNLRRNYVLNRDLRYKLVNLLTDRCLKQGLNLEDYRNSFIEAITDEIEQDSWIDFFNELDYEINKSLMSKE